MTEQDPLSEHKPLPDSKDRNGLHRLTRLPRPEHAPPRISLPQNYGPRTFSQEIHGPSPGASGGRIPHISFSVIIRLARQSDLPALEWFGQHTHYRKVMANSLAAQERGTARMVIAEINGFPVAQLCIDFSRYEASRRATFWALRVFEPFRGHGLGRLLMQSGEALVFARGWQLVELGVDYDNAKVLPFYKKLGYRVIGEERGKCYYRDHMDRLISEPVEQWIMHKPLVAQELADIALPAAPDEGAGTDSSRLLQEQQPAPRGEQSADKPDHPDSPRRPSGWSSGWGWLNWL